MSEVPKLYYYSTGDRSKVNPRWWDDEETKVHLSVIGMCEGIENDQRYRATANLRHARLYANMEIRGLSGMAHSRVTPNLPSSRVTLNVVRACVDTAAAKISKNRPRVLYLTEKGNAGLQRKAKKLTQYTDGQFDSANVYEETQRAFKEAAIFGTGAVKIFPGEKGMMCQRTPIDEIIVSDAEGIYGRPRTLYHRQWRQRDELAEKFKDNPKALEAIKSSTDAMDKEAPNSHDGQDMLYVVEAWHLRSGENADDGRHVIAIRDGCLLSEKWDRDYFPFAFFRWCERPLGFFASGIAEELVGIQIEINKILRDVSEALNLFAVPRVLQQTGSMVTKEINNTIGARYWYTGTKPEFITPSAMAPDVFNHLWQLYAKAFEIVGISQLSATAKKPAGLDAAVAIREYNDIETERFAIVGQGWEQFHVDIADIMISETRILAKEGGAEWNMKVKGSKFMQTIQWKDVDLEKDKYTMRAFPTNLLPSTPAGKLQRVKEMQDAGWLEKEFAMQLLDFPDVDQFVSLQTAAVEDINRALEMMLDEGKPVVPEPFMNLPLALRLAQSAYLKAKADNVEESHLELVRRFMSSCMQQIQTLNATAPQMQAQQPPALPPGAPAAGPAVPPQPQAQPQQIPVAQ